MVDIVNYAEELDKGTVFIGDSCFIEATLTDTAGAAIPVGTASWTLRTANEWGGTVLNKSVGTGITISGTGNNVVSVLITPAESALLAGDYYHAAKVTLSGTEAYTIFRGTLSFLPAGVA